jgi:hypothetical protein
VRLGRDHGDLASVSVLPQTLNNPNTSAPTSNDNDPLVLPPSGLPSLLLALEGGLPVPGRDATLLGLDGLEGGGDKDLGLIVGELGSVGVEGVEPGGVFDVAVLNVCRPSEREDGRGKERLEMLALIERGNEMRNEKRDGLKQAPCQGLYMHRTRREKSTVSNDRRPCRS